MHFKGRRRTSAEGGKPQAALPQAVLVLLGLSVVGQLAVADDTAAIHAASKAYREAVEAGDGRTLASLWMPEGDIVDADGNRIPAGEVAAAAGAAALPRIRMTETSIRFLGPDTAIEDGSVEILPPEGEPLRGRFAATWVRHEGRWKLAAVREAAVEPADGRATLADLDWMTGSWRVVDDADGDDSAENGAGPAIEVAARWNESRSYLVRVMKITRSAEAPPMRVTQWIGWDPIGKTIHSWKFGSDGTRGEAEWHREGRSWVAEARTIDPDGTQHTSLNIYTPDGPNRCRWQSLPTDIGDDRIPPVDLIMLRKSGNAPTPQGSR
jgi:uncharacterized protein (TIGR02246 family)